MIDREPEKPTLARTVHYVMPDGSHRAALIINEPKAMACDLNVSLMMSDTPQTESTLWAKIAVICTLGSVSYDGTGRRPHSWHWPERK